MTLPVIWSIQGLTLTPDEKAFFKENPPVGFILFDRNVKNPLQLKSLTNELHTLGKVHILIDQEGGRVQRLWPPYWEGLPFASTYGDWWEESQKKALKGVQRHAEKLAQMLLEMGIDVDCWPCLDVRTPFVHPVIGKRLFSEDEIVVSELANKAVQTMLQKGLMPVIKHIPGYGKTITDPHQELPVVKADLNALEEDFYPFLNANKKIWGMTAHVIYQALDKKNPATLSSKVISFIREEIGFEGPLLTDDIGMGALTGSVSERTRKALDAGCDIVLHCSGNLSEMKEMAKVLSPLSKKTLKRLQTAEKEVAR